MLYFFRVTDCIFLRVYLFEFICLVVAGLLLADLVSSWHVHTICWDISFLVILFFLWASSLCIALYDYRFASFVYFLKTPVVSFTETIDKNLPMSYVPSHACCLSHCVLSLTKRLWWFLVSPVIQVTLGLVSLNTQNPFSSWYGYLDKWPQNSLGKQSNDYLSYLVIISFLLFINKF